ncbi:hypothetical protein ACEPAF_1901 [Sanghuangporus sanghuang]
MAFSSNNSRIVSGSLRGIGVWDAATGQLAWSSLEGGSWIKCVAISPDGASIAAGYRDGPLKVWAMTTGQLIIQVGPFGGSWTGVTSLEFSPDGNRLASGHKDGNIIIWNTESWKVTSELSTRYKDPIVSIRFSPDGTQVASASEEGDNSIEWNTEQGRVISRPYEVHGRSRRLVFTGSGLYVVSSDNSSQIPIHELNAYGIHSTCNPLRFPGTLSRFSPSVYSHDGSRVVTCSREDVVRVWDMSDLLSISREDSTNSTLEWLMDNDGWIVGGFGGKDLLFWIPHVLRSTLCPCRNAAACNCESSTKLAFIGAALGDLWSERFTPSGRSLSHM